MGTWKLQLETDILRYKRNNFPSLSERIAAYKEYYMTDGCQKKAADVQTPAPQSTAPSLAGDIHTTETPFATLLYFYDKEGNEYSFSRRGMRHVQRHLPWQGHYHTHAFIEILYVVEGNFEQILLGSHRKFSAGEFVITDCNIKHADYVSGGSDAALLFLWLQPAYLDRLLLSYDKENALMRFLFHAIRRQQKEQNYLHLTPSPIATSSALPSPADDLPLLFEHLLEEDYNMREGSQDIIRGCLIRLLSILCHSYSVQLHGTNQEGKEKILLYEVERYIRMNVRDITAAQLEQTFHYHRNYFNLLLKKHRGIGFQQYVRSVRLEHAARMLTTTQLPVKEIALQSGYHNSSHFYHLFEQQYRMSPAEYRRQRST